MSVAISAKDVAALRKATGAGMMDCKKALEESSGDVEAAKTWLRERTPIFRIRLGPSFLRGTRKDQETWLRLRPRP